MMKMMRLGGNMRMEREKEKELAQRLKEEQEKVIKTRIVLHGKHHQEAMIMIIVTTVCGYQIAKIKLHGQVLILVMMIQRGQALVLIIRVGQVQVMMTQHGQAQVMITQHGQALVLIIKDGPVQVMMVQHGQAQVMMPKRGQAQEMMEQMMIVHAKDQLLHQVNQHVRKENQTVGVQV